MDDIYSKTDVFHEHFGATKLSDECLQTKCQKTDYALRSHRHSWAVRRATGAASLLNIFSLPHFSWASSTDDDEKVELTKAEVEALRSEIADADERETHLKARLEHLDEILKFSRLCGYLYIRTRWTELPGEPPVLDDADVDDWLPRFVVLQGSCIFYYLKSPDLCPQDTALLSDVVEFGQLPCFVQEDGQQRHAFYILTRHGLRFECSSVSKCQIGSWLEALRESCKLDSDAA